MTATDRLRALLDEHGVEHYDGTEKTLWGKEASGYRFSADELTSGLMSMHMWCETPEQAVEATLGRGECKNVAHAGWFECSACGRVARLCFASYCPECGRRVIDDCQ